MLKILLYINNGCIYSEPDSDGEHLLEYST